jgi:hypothetical protein
MAYQNGQIPSSALTHVQGLLVRIYLLTSSAYAWKAMRAACRKATGVTLKITSPYGGYRSLKAQFAMWADRYNRDKYPAGVAYPGVSVHGWGRSADINNWGAAAGWLNDNAARFGFHRTLGNEPWHYEHSGGSAGFTPIPITTETFSEESENSMILLYNAAVPGEHEERRAVVQPGVFFEEIGPNGAATTGEAIRQQRGLKPSAPQSAITVDVGDWAWNFWKTLGTPK